MDDSQGAPAALHFNLLGNVVVKLGQDEVVLETAKARALLIYLALTGRPQQRAHLVDLLWSEMPEASARRNLTTTLASLRKRLAPYLLVGSDTIAFNHGLPHTIDSVLFQQMLGDPQTADDLARLQKAVALYQGDFLHGLTVKHGGVFDAWVAMQREQLREQMLLALQRLLDEAVASADYAGGLAYANRLLAMDPWRESAHRQLMILHAQNGRREAALAQYDLCRRTLAEELGVDPMPETVALFERLLAADRPPAHNLPSQPNPFIGRITELGQIYHHLSDPACRLLTIVGPGGMGKTRLALEAARLFVSPERLLPAGPFPDGVYFVPPTGVAAIHRTGPAETPHHADALTAAIAEVLACPLQGGAPSRQLLSFLQNKALLLLLDNFEHFLLPTGITPELDLLERLLLQAPQVKILVTSRERLNLREEWVFTVGGLDYPTLDTAPHTVDLSAADLATYSAVALFLQRARQTALEFAPTPADMDSIVRLCRLLEGMPLGLELAATWVRDLTCGELVAEIERSKDFLTTSLRNVPARHRSLRAVFNHSWQMLPAQEQAVLCKLSVFQNGFDRQAAAAVAGVSLSMLARLADKSLVQRVEDPMMRGRYSMHEMIRQFAGEHLAAQPDEEARCRQAHGRYYARWTEAQEANLFNANQITTLHLMRQEADNLDAAWHHLVATGATAEIQVLAQGLAMFYSEEGRHREAITYMQRALDWLWGLSARTTLEDRLLTHLLWIQGALYVQIGEFVRAEALVRSCLDFAQRLNEPVFVAKGYYWLTRICIERDDLNSALAYAQDGLALFHALGDERGVANINAMLGRIYSRTQDYATSTQYFHAALAHLRRSEDYSSMAQVLTALGANAVAAGDFIEADAYLQEAYTLRMQVGGVVSLPQILLYRGMVAEATGDNARARTLWEAGIAACRQFGPGNTAAVRLAAELSDRLGHLRNEQAAVNRSSQGKISA